MSRLASHDKRIILEIPDRPPVSEADAWWVERIEAIRLEADTVQCPACDSTVDGAMLALKWCPTCSRYLLRGFFGRDRHGTHGTLWECLECRAARSKRYRVRNVRRGQLPLLEVAS